VFVSTIDSGGEPLHRVRVGRFKTPEETLPLKQRLQTAGFPSFRVAEP
jgi:cell division protein FtsN